MTDSRLDIALLIKTDSEWHRNIIQGIAQFAEDHCQWSFTIPVSNEYGEVTLPNDWQGAGVIFRATSQQVVDQIHERGVPAVNVSWLPGDSSTPQVVSDAAACATMVASYFTDKQYENFGYVGFPPWANYRSTIEDQLAAHYAKYGKTLSCFQLAPSATDTMGIHLEELECWLESLQKPSAIAAWSSFVGYQLIIACQNLELDVPRDISIVCIEHDPLWSALAPIPLSNLDQDPRKVGYSAARTLASLLAGESAPTQPQHISPISIVQRMSTEASAVKDPVLRLAINYIYEHAKSGISVKEVVSTMGVSRRSLEAKFRNHLDCSPAVFIRRTQLQLVARLLRTTNMSIVSICKRTGFSYPEVLMRSFKRHYGMTPMQFRSDGKGHSAQRPSSDLDQEGESTDASAKDPCRF